MDKLFPDMPINAGLEKVLALVSTSINKASQTLVSLSFLIIPVSLAIGIKMFQWLGPFAAVAALLLPLAGLMTAESTLKERAILPLSGENLPPTSSGKTAYADDGKDEDKASTTQDLLKQAHGGVAPPEHNPGPYVARPPGQLPSPAAAWDRALDGASEPSMQSAASLPTSTLAGGRLSAEASLPEIPAPEPVDPSALTADELQQIRKVLDKLAETIFGSPLQEMPVTRNDSLLFVNRMRQEIGLATLTDDSFPAVLAGAQEAATVVGCD